MSTPHNEAKIGQIADTVLMPGDPLRAKFIAENFLENAQCYNQVRGMLGYTGTYKGKRVSVQGSGMGIPSSLIYVNELFDVYGVKNVIRIGSAGAIQPGIKLRDIIIASAACTTSAINRTRFMGYDFAPVADFSLLHRAYETASKILDMSRVHVGPVLSSDEFYGHDEGLEATYAEYGVLALEMEAAGMYTIAPKYNARALAILTISDHVLTKEETTPEERAQTFTDMINLALEIAE